MRDTDLLKAREGTVIHYSGKGGGEHVSSEGYFVKTETDNERGVVRGYTCCEQTAKEIASGERRQRIITFVDFSQEN
jgi:hypothetical protein